MEKGEKPLTGERRSIEIGPPIGSSPLGMPRSQRRKETIVLRHWKKVTGWTLLTAFFAVGTLLAQDPVRHLQFMVGERATILDQVERQGYSYVRGTKEGGSSYT